MRSVIFTGAGAGKADGLPLETEIFDHFFTRAAADPRRAELLEVVSSILQELFGIDPVRSQRDRFPTFEEAIGVIDLALARDEALYGYAMAPFHVAKLQAARRGLVLALAATVARADEGNQSVHGKLVRNLRQQRLLGDMTFVTTNYDTLIDDAIEAEALDNPRGTGSILDYGLGSLVDRAIGPHEERRMFPCYKIHGSLNWLRCPACDSLDITYGSDGVIRLVDEPDGARCLRCEILRTPIIVPPSYHRLTSGPYLSAVLNHASRAMQLADCIVFCGYSFAAADIHVKYAVKRAQLNRDRRSRPLKIRIVNHYPSKPPGEVQQELERFTRFLGQDDVVDLALSFEQFANDPGSGLM